MKDICLAFNGFSTDAAKKSYLLFRVLNHMVASVERDIKVVTSTPKHQKIMEVSFSKHYNVSVTMDHDSGYISHHQESNSDSSLEHLSETVHSLPYSRPIYLSEDALLEKPEVGVKSENTSGNSTSPDTIVSTSVGSQKTTYSGFDDSDSNVSLEIPCSNQIFFKDVDIFITDDADDDCDSINRSLNINDTHLDNKIQKKNCTQTVNHFKFSNESREKPEAIMTSSVRSSISSDDFTENCVSSATQCTDQFKEDKNFLALNNITNMCNTVGDKKKRLTLIFSKNNKENIYSVKRKYRSTSPQQKEIPENDVTLDESSIPKKIIYNWLTIENETKSNALSNKENLKINVLDATLTELNSQEQALVLNVNNDSENVLNPEKSQLTGQVSLKNCENLENELILRKELDLDELVLGHENYEQHNSISQDIFNRQRENVIGEIDCIQQNISCVRTPKKKFENPVNPDISPDLFETEEVSQEVIKERQPLTYIAEERFVIKKDQKILKRAQSSLKGVLPPHSVTVIQLSINEMLNRLETNKGYFWTNYEIAGQKDDVQSSDNLNISNATLGESNSLLITTNKDYVNIKWPDILNDRYHGLHHNRSKFAEEFEALCLKYGERYVGAETQSTCTVFETNLISPTKRKQLKQRWAVKSPGRRLSHLARRRITFSSANLQGGASSSLFGSRARQILVDARKLDLLNRRRSPQKSPKKYYRRTPRKTPSKSPRLKSRTPSSSAKKKLAMRFRELTGEIENTVPSRSSEKSVFLSKRALFHSPDRDKKSNFFQPSTSGLSTFDNDLKKPGTKRALFISPSKRSPLKNLLFKRSPLKCMDLGVDKKRKQTDYDNAPPSKLARSVSMAIRPSESEVMLNFNRTKSDMNLSLNRSQAGPSGELSAVHKKKLQWAVYEALRSQNITPSHAQFKIFASILARVTRRLLPNLTSNGPKECGTTEKMLRIARIHVYAVIKGKSVDEIINEHLKSKMKNTKPQGYVSREEFNGEKKNTETRPQNCSQNQLENLNKKKLDHVIKPKAGTESRIDRIRKVINFGDDNK